MVEYCWCRSGTFLHQHSTWSRSPRQVGNFCHHWYKYQFPIVLVLNFIFMKNPSALYFTHVCRLRKGSAALKVDLFPDSFALAWVKNPDGYWNSFFLHYNSTPLTTPLSHKVYRVHFTPQEVFSYCTRLYDALLLPLGWEVWLMWSLPVDMGIYTWLNIPMHDISF